MNTTKRFVIGKRGPMILDRAEQRVVFTSHQLVRAQIQEIADLLNCMDDRRPDFPTQTATMWALRFSRNVRTDA